MADEEHQGAAPGGRARAAPAGQRGPRGLRGEVRQRITDAALRSFADHGLDGSSTRSIARDAGCDPALVRYYFTSKEELFELVTRRPEALDVQLAVMADLPHDDRAPFLARLVEACWDDPATSDFWRSLLRSSRTDASVARQVEDAWAEFVALGTGRAAGRDRVPEPPPSGSGGGDEAAPDARRATTWPVAVADGVVGAGDGTGPEGGTTGAVHGPAHGPADQQAAAPLLSRSLVEDGAELPDAAVLPTGDDGDGDGEDRGDGEYRGDGGAPDVQQRSVTALTSITGMLAAVHLWSSERATALGDQARTQALEDVLTMCFRPSSG